MRRVGVFILLVLFVMLATGCGGPVSVVKKFIKASDKGDFAKAKSYCTGEMLRFIEFTENMASMAGMDKSAFKEILGDINIDRKFTLEDKSESSASVVVSAMGFAATYKLVKVGGSWKIKDMEMPFMGSISDMMDPTGGFGNPFGP